MDAARPRQADDVTSSHHLLEQVGRSLAELAAEAVLDALEQDFGELSD